MIIEVDTSIELLFDTLFVSPSYYCFVIIPHKKFSVMIGDFSVCSDKQISVVRYVQRSIKIAGDSPYVYVYKIDHMYNIPTTQLNRTKTTIPIEWPHSGDVQVVLETWSDRPYNLRTFIDNRYVREEESEKTICNFSGAIDGGKQLDVLNLLDSYVRIERGYIFEKKIPPTHTKFLCKTVSCVSPFTKFVFRSLSPKYDVHIGTDHYTLSSNAVVFAPTQQNDYTILSSSKCDCIASSIPSTTMSNAIIGASEDFALYQCVPTYGKKITCIPIKGEMERKETRVEVMLILQNTNTIELGITVCNIDFPSQVIPMADKIVVNYIGNVMFSPSCDIICNVPVLCLGGYMFVQGEWKINQTLLQNEYIAADVKHPFELTNVRCNASTMCVDGQRCILNKNYVYRIVLTCSERKKLQFSCCDSTIIEQYLLYSSDKNVLFIQPTQHMECSFHSDDIVSHISIHTISQQRHSLYRLNNQTILIQNNDLWECGNVQLELMMKIECIEEEICVYLDDIFLGKHQCIPNCIFTLSIQKEVFLFRPSKNIRFSSCTTIHDGYLYLSV